MRSVTVNDTERVTGRRTQRALVTAMCLGVVLAQLDTSLLNLALHRIGAGLRAGLSSLQWMVDSYNLVYASSILAGGTMGDRYGRKRVFLLGVVLFTGGSVVCAAAPSAAWLIAGRAVTGLGAGLELPTSLAILSATFDDARERAQAIGTWAAMNGVAFALGPTLGGVMVDRLGWRSIFVVAVPVGLATLRLAARSVGDARALTGRRLDVTGQVLAALALVLLAYGIIERASPAAHRGVSTLAVGGALLALAAFVAVELRVREPLVPLRIFRRVPFSAALLVAALMTFGMYGLLLLLPMSLQVVRGASAFHTGLALLPMSIAFALTSPASGRLADRVGPRVPMAGGMALIGAGFLLLAAVPLDGPLAPIVLALLLPGIGMGLNTGPAMAQRSSFPGGRTTARPGDGPRGGRRHAGPRRVRPDGYRRDVGEGLTPRRSLADPYTWVEIRAPHPLGSRPGQRGATWTRHLTLARQELHVLIPVRDLSARGAAFGTSGVRGTVDALTDEVAFAYTTAFLQAVAASTEAPGAGVAVGYDLRPSSPRIATACAAACAAQGRAVVNCGPIPTPALAHCALQRRLPAIVITGSHIPFDRNGIKFYSSRGEILKEDEAAITAATVDVPDGAFESGMLRRPPPLPAADPAARDLYRRRYLDYFAAGFLRGKRIGVYQHSSVARDLLSEVLQELGAEVIALGRTDTFVPVDTEAVSDADQRQAREWVAAHRLDALVSTDGDADRPLVAHEGGAWFRGDVVGMLCAAYVHARTVVTPVSSNTAVDRWGVFGQVVRTRIGSPYVIAAMSEALAAGKGPVVGYEANGGFLLGSDVSSARGTRLAALPTRDALLPILSLLAMAAERRCALSGLTAELPARYTASDRLQRFDPERSRRLLTRLRSGREALQAFLGETGEIADVNEVDGVRVTLRSGDIVHFRPSGNAPELRCYAEADTPDRARQLCAWGLRAAAEA